MDKAKKIGTVATAAALAACIAVVIAMGLLPAHEAQADGTSLKRHTYEIATKDSNAATKATSTSPKTGDSMSSVAILVAVGAIAALVIIVLSVARTRKQR